MSRFVHLHTHSHYSLLEAVPKLDALITAAKADGQTALALTDLGTLYGAIEFYKECTKAGIKPILGVEIFVAPRTRFDKEPRVDDRPARLVLLVRNMNGYKNLVRLVSAGFVDGFYERPRVDRELLEKYHEGLVCIMPAMGGEHVLALSDGSADRARESLAWHKKIFGDPPAGGFYVEITRHPEIEGHDARQKKVVELARHEHVELVAGQEVYYLSPDDAPARRS